MSLVELEDPQRPVQIELYMDGSAFDRGIPVHLLMQGFETSQTILDRSYLGLSGRSRFTAEGSINSFSLTEAHSDSGIVIAQNEAAFFDIPSSIDPHPVELDCEIFDFNKFDNNGKLRVFDGQALPNKDYKFSVVGNQADSDYIEAMLRRSVKIVCLREVTVDPLAQEKIVRLQVLKVA